MSFQQVKAGALEFLLELEKKGLVTRKDSFQGILNAIASDVRSKHRKRVQRQQEIASMKEALKSLQERQKDFQAKVEAYQSFRGAAMQTMQNSKGLDCGMKCLAHSDHFGQEEKNYSHAIQYSS